MGNDINCKFHMFDIQQTDISKTNFVPLSASLVTASSSSVEAL